MQQGKKEIISQLQKNILQWQGFSPPPAGKYKSIGLGIMEAAFPNGIFPTGAIHEMICPTPEQSAATIGLVAGLLATLMQKKGACIWISRSCKLFPPSLAAFNVEPDQVIFIDVKTEKEALWVMEEALKYEGLAAVIAEVREINAIQSRRLQLAVESSKVTGFVLRTDPRKPGINTCVARWQVTSIASHLEDELPGVGYPRWQVDLLKVRNGNPGSWQLEWAGGQFVEIEQAKKPMDLYPRQIA